MTKLRVHVLYEHGADLHPYCSGHIRLLRPLSHPTVRDRIELTSSRRYDVAPYDVVVVERLWRPLVNLDQARRLIERVRQSGAKLVYSQDDNIYDLRVTTQDVRWFTDELIAVMELFAREADGVLVTTGPLKERMARYNDNIAVVPNALDERLMCADPRDRVLRRGDRLVIGYMGTRTHDEDLEMIAPALREIKRRHGARVAFEIVGAVANTDTLGKLRDLDFTVVQPPPDEADYPLFFSWFTRTIAWDIGLAPLRANPFSVCKSDIKLLDYAAIGAAGVFSRIAPYDSVPTRGMVAGNDAGAWTDAIEQLVSDDDERRRLADSAATHLSTERTLAHRARDFADAVERLVS